MNNGTGCRERIKIMTLRKGEKIGWVEPFRSETKFVKAARGIINKKNDFITWNDEVVFSNIHKAYKYVIDYVT
jgi:hypothetical protein